MITISIVEDHRDTRESLVALVNGTKGLRCLSTYSTGEAALRGVPVEKPQIALVDINLPGMSGIECVARLKAKMPSLEVVMLTTYEETELIFNSLRAGANGYLLKNMPPDELIAALEQVHAGGAPMSMQIARKVVDHFHQIRDPSDIGRLTPREHEILTWLAKGCLDKEIVGKLGIGFTTVRTHLKHIYEKLHVQTRTEATAKFLKQQS
jgi:DNA-binding NarL/FixJ family response regulator